MRTTPRISVAVSSSTCTFERKCSIERKCCFSLQCRVYISQRHICSRQLPLVQETGNVDVLPTQSSRCSRGAATTLWLLVRLKHCSVVGEQCSRSC